MGITVGNAVPGNLTGVSVATSPTIGAVGNAAPAPITSVGDANGALGQGGVLPDQGFSGSVPGATTGGGGGVPGYPNSNGVTAPDPNLAIAASRRGVITDLAHSILNVYDSLYPQLDTAGADQGRLVNQKYDTEGKGIVDQFNREFPVIGQAYAARGAYDSGYRVDAEGNAANALTNVQDQQGQARAADLAKVGQFVQSGKSSLDANKNYVNDILSQIQGSTDVNQLTQLQTAIQQKLLEAQSQGANLNTQGGYVGQLSSLVPTQDQTVALQSQLSSIIQGQAPAMLKKSVGIKQIQTSGLPDQQKQQLINDFVTQVDQAQQPLPSQPPAGV